METVNFNHWVITLVCVDGPGIVHAVTGAIADAGGNITESQQFTSLGTGRFFMRLEVESIADRAALEAKLIPVVKRFKMDWTLDVVGRPIQTLILVSKEGHCLADLLFRNSAGQLGIDVPLVLSNHPDLGKLAGFYEIPFETLQVNSNSDMRAFEDRLIEVVTESEIELVVLARFMRVLSPETCTALAGKAINIHHSFLPGFKGANPYRQAHERGVKLIGATAHFVTDDLDEGPIIEQNVVRVDHSSSPEALKRIGQNEESRTLTQAVGWLAQRRVLLDGKRTVIFH
ncbi:MAG: formyltetrahydrofolate deformylase [Microbacteriaceae bacterium]|nr:formyltetrahydrofolate deformylase [Microbacteriaceae bacterium]